MLIETPFLKLFKAGLHGAMSNLVNLQSWPCVELETSRGFSQSTLFYEYMILCMSQILGALTNQGLQYNWGVVWLFYQLM